MDSTKRIAILCNYVLLPERVGGMDYFFWQFDANCKLNSIQVDWFFPNEATHGQYSAMTIKSSNGQAIESFFLDYCQKNQVAYSHVVTHFLELCTPFFYKLNRISNAKVIGVDHNPRPLHGYSLKKKIEKKIKGILFSKYIDLFVGVSNYTKTELLYDFGFQLKKKAQVIYNGVVIKDILENKRSHYEQPTFLVASHLRESKGIQDLIKAVYLLPDTIKAKIKIDVYGDGPYKDNLIGMVVKYQLAHCFIFKGSCDNLKVLYSNYDYMLQPTYMECFSLSILESLAANVPVITTSVGGNEEVVTDTVNGYIFKPKDIMKLKGIIESIYKGTFKIESNTREIIEINFSLDKMVQNHLQLVL